MSAITLPRAEPTTVVAVSRRPGPWAQFRAVFGIQMARLRSAWSRYVIVATVMPLGIAVVVRAAGGRPDPDEALQIVAGAVLLAVTLTSVTNLAQRMSVLSDQGAFDYYATLPIARSTVLLAVFTSYLVFALPGSVLVYLATVPLFHLHYVWSPLLIVFVLLGSFSLAGLGAWIGLVAGDEQLASMLANLVMMAVLFLGIVTPAHLPPFLRVARWALPSTYAVQGLRDALAGSGSVGRSLGECVVMLGFMALFAPLAARSMQWRRR